MTELIFTLLPPDDQGPESVSANVKNYFFEIALATKLFKQECSVGAPFFSKCLYYFYWCNQNRNPTCLNMINIELYGEKNEKGLVMLTFIFMKKK